MASIDGALSLNKTASGLIKTGSGMVYGIVVNSHTSGTVKLWDGLTATGSVVVDTYTYPSGSQVITFPQALTFSTGLYYTLGGTANVNIVYN